MKCCNCPLTLPCYTGLLNSTSFFDASLCPICGRFICTFAAFTSPILLCVYSLFCERRRITDNIKAHWQNHKFAYHLALKHKDYPMWEPKQQVHVMECKVCNGTSNDLHYIVWNDLEKEAQ